MLGNRLANISRDRIYRDFPDSMKTNWDTDKVSSLLRDAFAPGSNQSTTKSSSSQQPTASIDVLITFDSQGISSHPNHISLYHGARAFVASLTANKPGWASPVDLYTLTSVNVFRKYAGILDMFSTLGSTAFSIWGGDKKKKDMKMHPPGLVFMHGFGNGGWVTAREAMTKAHVSQMVWFRYGWITLSRYMFMNDLKLEKV